MQFNSIAAPEITSRAGRAQHIVLSLRGIQARANASADETSPDWVDLAPRLVIRPVQVDLMAPATDSCAPASLSGNLAVAGVYRQIRLLLVSNQPTTEEPVPYGNACGNVGFHCIVTADGAMHPLVFDREAPEILIRSDRIPGGSLRILPDTRTTVAFEFDPYSSAAVPAGETVRLHPALTLEARPSCASAAP